MLHAHCLGSRACCRCCGHPIGLLSQCCFIASVACAGRKPLNCQILNWPGSGSADTKYRALSQLQEAAAVTAEALDGKRAQVTLHWFP
jgi:hypothetical protein